MNESQKVNLRFVLRPSCCGRDGVKGQDERQTTAPLTPPRPHRNRLRLFQLDRGDAVIQGGPLRVFSAALVVPFRDREQARGSRRRGDCSVHPSSGGREYRLAAYNEI